MGCVLVQLSWGKSWWGHYTDCCSTLCEVILPCGDIKQGVDTLLYVSGAQWLSGRVLDSRPKSRGFEPHCVVSLS